jgi:hypothetical protein
LEEAMILAKGIELRAATLVEASGLNDAGTWSL